MSIPMELVSGVIGALIGGGFTVAGSWVSIHKQFKEQRKLSFEQEQKQQLTAIFSVHEEVMHNLKVLQRIDSIIESHNEKFLDFSEANAQISFMINRWEKHFDTLRMMDSLKDFRTLNNFYTLLSVTISINYITHEATLTLLEEGNKSDIVLKAYQNFVSKKNQY